MSFVFTAVNIQRMSDEALLDQFEEFDQIRVTSPNQTRVDRAIEIMNLIACECERREFTWTDGQAVIDPFA